MVSVVLLAIFIAYTAPALCVLTANCGNMSYQAASDPTQQTGYNLCNATTENQSSLCQTAFFNGLDDFCLWGPAIPTDGYTLNDNQQEATIAWCTKAGHGTRLIKPGTFYTITYVKTPDYIEVSGVFDASVHQTPLNYLGDDPRSVNIAGEYDPRGTDGRGSPIGGLMFSNAFSDNSGAPGQYVQAVEWVSIVGWDAFWLRLCDPNVADSGQYCSRWDPSWDGPSLNWHSAVFEYEPTWNYTYESCLGDSRPLGLVAIPNATVTYTGQPLPSNTWPAAATSSCTTYSHSELFYGAATVSPGAEVCSTSISTSSLSASSLVINAPVASIQSSHVSKSRVGAIVGSVVAALIALSLLVAWMLIRKRRQAQGIPAGDFDLTPKSGRTLATSEVTSTSPLSPYSISTHPSLTPGRRHANGYIPNATSNLYGPTTGDQSSMMEESPPNYAALSPREPLNSLSPIFLEPSGRNSVMQHDDLGRWAAENRSLIPQELEQKLRAAGYSPSDDPSQIPAREWKKKYGVGHFELKRLQDIYARQNATSSPNSTEVRASGQGVAPWRLQS